MTAVLYYLPVRMNRAMETGNDPEFSINLEEVRMDDYIGSNDDLSKLLMSFGSISKGFGGQGQRMGETASFNVSFRANADPAVKDYFLKIYGENPEKINFFLPCDDIDKCITAPYTAFNGAHNLIAKSDGEIFTYIANLSNPLNTAEPYLSDGKRCSDGQVIPHQQDLGFLGKPNMQMKMSGQMFVFIKELLEAGVFQTMAFKFHTTTDRDMLRKRLCFIRNYAAGINVPLTAIPLFLTKFKKSTSFIDPSGTPRRSEHFYLDLGLVHFIGKDERHPFNAAAPSSAPKADPAGHYAEVKGEPAPAEMEASEADVQECAAETENVNPGEFPDSSGNTTAENGWKNEVFSLDDDQQQFVRENVSSYGSRYGIRPELLEGYKDKTGTPVSDLSLEDILGQIKVADEYLVKIMNRELTVDKQTETRAKKRRWALITASLIKQNKYTYY